MSWRPHNETAEDLTREYAVAHRFAYSKGYSRAVKLSPTLYGLDFSFHDAEDHLKAMAEIKCRQKVYDPFFISLAKFDCLLHWAKFDRDMPVFLVIAVHTILYVHEMGRGGTGVYAGLGGSDRGQNGDKEPMIYIPLRNFEVQEDRT